MTSLETEKALAERFLLAAFEADDRRTVRRMLAPRFVAHDPAVPRPPAGPAAFERDVLDELHGGFPDLSLAIEDVVAEGDDVVCRFTLTGTHAGTFLGTDPTGESVVLTGLAQLRLCNDGVTDLWTTLDSLDLLAQLGVLDGARSRAGWSGGGHADGGGDGRPSGRERGVRSGGGEPEGRSSGGDTADDRRR